MISKGRGFILVFVACVFVLPFVSAQAADELIAPQVYSGFQQQGAQLARDARELEAVLGRIQHKRLEGKKEGADFEEFRSLRRSLKAQQTALLKKLAAMEASLAEHKADRIFIERIRRMTDDARDRFGDLSERLDREDFDDLAEQGLNVRPRRPVSKNVIKGKAKAAPAKGLRPSASEPSTQNSETQGFQPNAPTNSGSQTPKPNIDSIPQPQKVELPDEPATTFPRTDGKLDLLQKDGSYQLVNGTWAASAAFRSFTPDTASC